MRSRHRPLLLLLIATAVVASGCGSPFSLTELLDGPDGAALSVSPPSATVVAFTQVELEASGGVPPYEYELASGLGSVSGSVYTAGTPGTATLVVTDAVGGQVEAVVTVQSAPGTNVEYVVASISSTDATPNAGSSITETFTLQNTGSDDGAASVYWSAYLSPDNDLLTTPNYLVASGVEPALGATGGGADTASVTIGGNWSSSTGTWYLIVQAQADDEITQGQWTASPAFDVQAVDVDYYVSVAPPGGSPALGSAISESFTIQNKGSMAGSADLAWSVHRSTDANLDAGDELLVSDTITGGLSSGGSQGPIAISGTWPATEETNYLIVRLDALDDANITNNTPVSAPYFVSANEVDYEVTQITENDTTPKAGTLIKESFTITNTGAVDGTSDVTWDVYVSSTTTASGGPVASGTITGGLTAGSSYTVGSIPAAWPDLPGESRYLVVVVSGADDADSLNNETAGGVFTLQGAPDYSVTAAAPSLPVVPEGGNSNTGEVLSDIGVHSFTIGEVAGYPGDDPVEWSVHWSLDSTLDSSDIEIASGILSATDTVWPETITLPGTTLLPSNWGYWRILIKAEAADDTVASNDSFVSAEIPIWQTTGNVDTDPDAFDDDLYVGEEDDFAVLLNLGDSVDISGGVDETGYNDLFKVTLGSGVSAVRAVATWVTADDTLDLYMYQLGDDPTAPPYRAVEIVDDLEDSDAVTAPDSPWTGLTANGVYYVNVYSLAAPGDVGASYTLTVTAY